MGCIVLLLLGLLASAAWSVELKGTVKDYSTGRPVAGADIDVPAADTKTTTDSKGIFHLSLPAGEYVMRISRAGYHVYTWSQAVPDNGKTLKFTIELKPSTEGEATPEALGETPRYDMDEVTIMATRASSRHPVTYSNLNQQEIQQRNFGQDLPQLLTEMPNVTSYSDGGNGVGYSYLKMRGFSQNRVAVQVNGTPLNDAGTGEVFWIDLPDFAEDMQDLQVQRGVGSSLYGPAAFGGTINIVTRAPGLLNRPSLKAEATYGSWGTRRAMIQFESNRIGGRYGVAGRFTRMSTNGYRDQSWANMWSYYLSAARFTKAHTTRVVFYGGPERTHLAYDGVPKSYLDGKISGDKDKDRRFNPLTYANEIDNFFQPHYELHDEWKLTGRLNLDNSLYMFRGDGFYDQFRSDQELQKYFHRPMLPDVTTDVLRRRNVGETDWGWIPRLTFDYRFGETTLGGELRSHEAHHDGQLVWSSFYPYAVGPDYRYYDYRIRKTSTSGYVHNLITVIPDLNAMADLQVQQVRYRMDRDRSWGVTFDKSYSSVNPRFGLNWQFLRPEGRVAVPVAVAYVNFSWAQREPTYKDIYDPQDSGKLPAYDSVQFVPVAGGYRYNGPSLKPEKMRNLEIGTNVQWLRARVGLNYYWMSIRDELVPYGPLDELGVPMTTNADRTLHHGVELVAAYSPEDWISLSGNVAWNGDHFVNYGELDWSSGGLVSRNGKRIAQDPAMTANLRVETTYRGFFVNPSFQFVSRQYIDNTEDKATAVPDYGLLNLDFGYRFTRLGTSAKAVELRIRVNNVLNKDYLTAGWWGDEPVYIVGAPRSTYATLAVEL
jgi:iron complex outermembrane receptor protein